MSATYECEAANSLDASEQAANAARERYGGDAWKAEHIQMIAAVGPGLWEEVAACQTTRREAINTALHRSQP